MTAPSPAHSPARAARVTVEAVLMSLVELPARFDRRSVGDRLQEAIARLFTVLDTGPEAPAHDVAVFEATTLLGEARSLLAAATGAADDATVGSAVERLDEARALLDGASSELAAARIRRLVPLPADGPEASDPAVVGFLTSQGVPQLHAVQHTPLIPQVRFAEVAATPPPAPPPERVAIESLEELRAFAGKARSGQAREEEAGPDAAAEPQPEPDEAEPTAEAEVPTEVAALRRVARDCLEELAGLSTLRSPSPLERWVDQAPFEQRLLANLDAFVTFGDAVLPLVTLYHAEASVPDRARAFAVAFVLGCLRGTDTVASAVTTLQQSPPEEYPGFVDGFTLASNPAIDAELVALLYHPNAGLARAAVQVLGARGTLPDDAIPVLLGRPEPELRLAVTRALGRSGSREVATSALQDVLALEPSDALFLVCVESLLRRGHGGARDQLRMALAPQSSPARADGAACLLALSGRGEDAGVLISQLRSAPTPRLARGLGRFGHVHAVPALVELLGQEDEELVAASAEALDRITGAGLREEREVPWSDQEPPRSGFVPPRPVPMRKIETIVQDPSAWTTWWNTRGRSLDPRFKLRRGAPFSPVQIAEELGAVDTPPDRRREAALELVLNLTRGLLFSTADWVARQQSQLAELTDAARRAGVHPGSWCFAGAGSAAIR